MNMAALLQDNPHYEINVEQFRQAGALDILLFMFQEQESYPPAVIKPLVSVLKSLLHKVPTGVEIQKIVDYLVSSHTTPDIVMTPYHLKQKNLTEKRQYKMGSLTSGTLRLKRQASETNFEDFPQFGLMIDFFDLDFSSHFR